MMIGRAERISRRAPRPQPAAAPFFELRNYSSAAGHENISLSVRPGEILGLYGLVGAGRSELAKAVLGLSPQTGGEILVGGKPVKIGSVAEALRPRHRLCERGPQGRRPDPAAFGAGQCRHHRVEEARQRAGLPARRHGGDARWARCCSKLEVKTPSLDQTIGNLSGGNQQKVSVAKWIAAGVKLLIIDEPSVGIDIKTKAYLHDLIHELAESGTAVLLITSDLTEMVDVADRVAVMDDYRIEGVVENDRNYERVSTAIMALIHGRKAA